MVLLRQRNTWANENHALHVHMAFLFILVQVLLPYTGMAASYLMDRDYLYNFSTPFNTRFHMKKIIQMVSEKKTFKYDTVLYMYIAQR